MMTVNEVSKITGVSVRALQYYDSIGLLRPAEHTGSGYRLYDESSFERLQQILLFRELEFPLKEIKRIIDSPGFDRNKALEQQIELLTLKRDHLDDLIAFARGIKETGEINMSFNAFDETKIKEYSERARKEWGDTQAYKEYEKKTSGWSEKDRKEVTNEFMQIFVEFGKVKNTSPDSEAARCLVVKLKDYISEHFYTCTNEILAGLGKMYAAGGEFTENIDAAGGLGTAEFTAKAIEKYCLK